MRKVIVVIIIVAIILFIYHQISTREQHPNVLIIVADTLRADRLGCYGYTRNTSSSIDNLSRKGILFENCNPQWPKTWPSMASFLSGTYPKTNGIRYERLIIPSSLKMMSEFFRDAGYMTAAIISNFTIGKTYGFQKGFDNFVESWQHRFHKVDVDIDFFAFPDRVKSYTDAENVTDLALKWFVEYNNDKPFFLLIHYMDPHGPYVPPAKYRLLFNDEKEPEQTLISDIPEYQRQQDPLTGQIITDLEFYRRQYDREIRHMDDELFRLIQEVYRRDMYKETIICFTSDHGESFSEHGDYLGHGKNSYQPGAHIPLIMVHKGAAPTIGIVQKPVSLIDISASLMSLSGLDVPPMFEGSNLVNLFVEQEQAQIPFYTFMESGNDQDNSQLTVRWGKWKLIHIRSEVERALMTGQLYELYNLDSDPGETNNLIDKKPEIAKILKDALRTWHITDKQHIKKGGEVSLNKSEVQLLESLGYLE